MRSLALAIEDGNYLIFLKEVRNITHRRFNQSSKRSRILKKLTEEIHNLEKTKKNNLPEREEIIQINNKLLEEKDKNLHEALKELEQCEKEISELSQEQFELELQEVNKILDS